MITCPSHFPPPPRPHTHSEVEPETLTAVIAKEIHPRSLTTARLLQGIIRSRPTPTATPTTPHQRKSMGGALSTPRRHSIGNTPLRGGSSFSALGQNLLPTVVEAGERSKWIQSMLTVCICPSWGWNEYRVARRV